MKRTFATVLAILLALSLAAPTLAASGWDKPVEEKLPLSGFTLSANKFEYYPSVSGGYAADGQYFRAWDDSKGIVRDTRGRVVFNITIPDEEDLQELYPYIYMGDLILTITITNVNGVAPVYLDDDPVDYMPELRTDNIENNIFTLGGTSGKKRKQKIMDGELMFVFSAAGEGDVVASISLELENKDMGAAFIYQSQIIAAFAVPSESEGASLGDWAFTYIDEEHELYEGILFDTDSSGKIQRLYILQEWNESGKEELVFQVLVDANGKIAFTNGGPTVQEGDDGYADLKARFDFFMGALGFQWDGSAKYMNWELIKKNLISPVGGAASVTFPGGHQTIMTPLAMPPQTGDQGTIAGYAMLVLAAALAVVFAWKRHRA